MKLASYTNGVLIIVVPLDCFCLKWNTVRVGQEKANDHNLKTGLTGQDSHYSKCVNPDTLTFPICKYWSRI